MGRLHTSNPDITSVSAISTTGDEVIAWNKPPHELLSPNTKPTISMALAGVGNPINDEVWRSSKLNIPNRSDENAAIIKGTASRKCPVVNPSEPEIPSAAFNK